MSQTLPQPLLQSVSQSVSQAVSQATPRPSEPLRPSEPARRSRQPHTVHPEAVVAVLGAGPGGLVAARWLLARGLEPVLFEAADRLGGQWNRASSMSGTWQGMRTNTSRILTAFSDLEHDDGTATYPRQDEMLAYLERYAEKFDLARRIRLGTRVDLLDRSGPRRWLITSTCK